MMRFGYTGGHMIEYSVAIDPHDIKGAFGLRQGWQSDCGNR